jgi:hypothetical protein
MFSPPSAPDPNQVASTQYRYNTQQYQDMMRGNAAAGNRVGPGGYSQYSFDPATGMPTGITSGFAPGLGFTNSNLTGNLGLLGMQVPGSPVDFSGANYSPYGIAAAGTNALYQMQSPLMQQAINQVEVNDTNRGLPVGSQAWNTDMGNVMRNLSAGQSTGLAGIWNAMPQNQSMLTNTAITQGLEPYQQMGANLGLLTSLYGLLPQAPSVSGTEQPVNYAQISNDAYNNQMRQYQATWGPLTQLGSSGMGLMGAMMLA